MDEVILHITVGYLVNLLYQYSRAVFHLCRPTCLGEIIRTRVRKQTMPFAPALEQRIARLMMDSVNEPGANAMI